MRHQNKMHKNININNKLNIMGGFLQFYREICAKLLWRTEVESRRALVLAFSNSISITGSVGLDSIPHPYWWRLTAPPLPLPLPVNPANMKYAFIPDTVCIFHIIYTCVSTHVMQCIYTNKYPPATVTKATTWRTTSSYVRHVTSILK